MQTSFTSTGVKDIALPKLATGMYIVQLETATGKLNAEMMPTIPNGCHCSYILCIGRSECMVNPCN